jgi:hypothetical protein
MLSLTSGLGAIHRRPSAGLARRCFVQHAIAARRPSPETALAHDPLDPLAADGLALGQGIAVLG